MREEVARTHRSAPHAREGLDESLPGGTILGTLGVACLRLERPTASFNGAAVTIIRPREPNRRGEQVHVEAVEGA